MPIYKQLDPGAEKGRFRLNIFSTGLFLALIASGVDLMVFVLFLKAVGAREYCCVAVESRLEALFFVPSPRATRARARRALV